MIQRPLNMGRIVLCCAMGVAQAAEQRLTQNHAEKRLRGTPGEGVRALGDTDQGSPNC